MIKKINIAIWVIFILLLTINITFLIEISKNKELNDFFYKGEPLSNKYLEVEKIHMQEVKDLVSYSLSLSLFLLILIFLTTRKPELEKIGKSLIVISILSIFGAISFQSFFHTFHLLFFNSNNWLLPSNSILIQTYPLEYWKNKFIQIIIINLFIGLILLKNKSLYSILNFQKNAKRRKKKNTLEYRTSRTRH